MGGRIRTQHVCIHTYIRIIHTHTHTNRAPPKASSIPIIRSTRSLLLLNRSIYRFIRHASRLPGRQGATPTHPASPQREGSAQTQPTSASKTAQSLPARNKACTYYTYYTYYIKGHVLNVLYILYQRTHDTSACSHCFPETKPATCHKFSKVGALVHLPHNVTMFT